MTQSPRDFDVRTETPEVPRPVPTAPHPNVHNALAEHTSPSQAQHRNAHSPLDKNYLGLAQGSREQTLLREYLAYIYMQSFRTVFSGIV